MVLIAVQSTWSMSVNLQVDLFKDHSIWRNSAFERLARLTGAKVMPLNDTINLNRPSQAILQMLSFGSRDDYRGNCRAKINRFEKFMKGFIPPEEVS